MKIHKIRSLLYKTAKLLGDLSAVSSNRQDKIIKRITRRITGKATGKLFRRLIK